MIKDSQKIRKMEKGKGQREKGKRQREKGKESKNGEGD
jgi:hypothetical protein